MDVKLKTQRLLLRPLDVRDAETVHEYASDAETARYMLFLPNKRFEDTVAFLQGVRAEWQKEKPSFYEFAVELDGNQIGAVSVSLDGDTAELGWILNRRYHNRGYATEAAMAVKDFAVQTLGQTRLRAHCDTRNFSSARVMEKLGFVRVGEEPRQYPDERGEAREYAYLWRSDASGGHFDEK